MKPIGASFLKLISGSLVVGLIAIFWYCQTIIQNSQAHLQIYQKEITFNFEQYIKDQNVFKDVQLFSSSNNGRDVGEWLNPRVKWTGGKSQTQPDILDLDNKTIQLVGRSWGDPNQFRNFNKLDSSWIEIVQQYDYWDFYRMGPQKTLSEPDGELVSPFTIPVPDMSNLVAWAKIRLMQGYANGRILAAISEVHHLARLTFSTESLIGSMTTISLLTAEREAFELAVQEKLIANQDLNFVPSRDDIVKFKRALWGIGAFLSYSSPEEIIQKILEKPQLPIGACGALFETNASGLFIQPYVQNKPTQKSLMDHLYTRGKKECRLSYLKALEGREVTLMKKILKPTTSSLDLFVNLSQAQNSIENQLLYYGWSMPYINEALSINLYSQAQTNFLALYKSSELKN